ncbi:MAG TPA: Rrf2 family transcriptional regulator [Myxococcota bacterium]|nr:Rrf2 family transcriptional regulator [Myxococcota bacterium]HQK51486.1 Rrf2 family transcriptional regulator [Myxococcota bacterium]
MRLTRATEYAYRALRFLGTCREERWYSIQEIAVAEDMPVQFLAKVMQHLTQAGLVQSACGKTGGYRLARAPEDIRMADVFLAMEGPLSVNTCLMYPTECRFREHCKVHHVWDELQQAILGVLGRHTLAEILPDQPYQVLARKGKGRGRAGVGAAARR